MKLKPMLFIGIKLHWYWTPVWGTTELGGYFSFGPIMLAYTKGDKS